MNEESLEEERGKEIEKMQKLEKEGKLNKRPWEEENARKERVELAFEKVLKEQRGLSNNNNNNNIRNAGSRR
jgi:hypothetical protein